MLLCKFDSVKHSKLTIYSPLIWFNQLGYLPRYFCMSCPTGSSRETEACSLRAIPAAAFTAATSVSRQKLSSGMLTWQRRRKRIFLHETHMYVPSGKLT